MEKKKISFGNIENQGDDFLRYSRSLSFSERLQYMQDLRRSAWGEKYELEKKNLKDGKKQVEVMMASAEESLEDFFVRVANR